MSVPECFLSDTLVQRQLSAEVALLTTAFLCCMASEATKPAPGESDDSVQVQSRAALLQLP